MTHYAAPALFALFLWWFSTGAVLCLGRRAESTFANVMVAMTALAAMAFFGLYRSAQMATPAGAYLGFGCALVLWAWHEMSFLFGHLTGSRRTACPPGLTGLKRFRAAFETISHHEIALFATLVVVLAITWGGANPAGALTFLVLWAMRISAKLNLFFGAPHLADEMLPARLSHLKSYFRRDRVSPVFAVSVTAGTAALAIAAHGAWTASDAAGAVGGTLVAALLALAVMEHWFLVLPVRDAALWRWAMPPASSKAAPVAPYASLEAGGRRRPAGAAATGPDGAGDALERGAGERAAGERGSGERPAAGECRLGPNAAGRADSSALGLTARAVAKQT